MAMQSTATATPGYATEMQLLKNKISQLKTIIITAVEQIKQALESLHATPHNSATNDMETDVADHMNSEHPTAPNNFHPNQLDLPAIISEQKMT